MVGLRSAFGEGRERLAAVGIAVVVGIVLAACGNGSSTPATSTSGTAASIFSAMKESGLGQVLVDGNERTVYVLTSGNHKNVPCTSSNGCTNVWPSLPLPSSKSAPMAGNGVQAGMLGTMKLADGKTYPTYNGWLMYEYSGDSGPGQAGGQGIASYGGTWYVLSPSGVPITTASSGSTTSGSNSGSGSGGSGY